MRSVPRRLALAVCLAAVLAAGWALAQDTVFHGNAQSHIFHRQGCRYFDCKACTVVFQSREAAVAAGYKPCKVCNP